MAPDGAAPAVQVEDSNTVSPPAANTEPLDLTSLRNEFFNCNFEKALQLVLRARQSNIALVFPETDEMAALSARGIVSELFDYAGDYEWAREVIADDGKRCEEYLVNLVRSPRGAPRGTDIDPRRSLKRRVWTVLHWGVTFYRRGQFLEARRRFQLCRKVVEDFVSISSYPANGTLARIHYVLALVDREQCNYVNAHRHFTESMNYAWQTLETSGADVRTPEDTRRRSAMTQFNIARCLGLGLGFVHYAEGNLDLAAPVLLGAKALLALQNESLIRSYVEVVYACVRRSRDGDDPEALARIISSLRTSLKVFRKYRHAYYSVRACNQLALAYLQSARNIRGANNRTRAKAVRNAERYLAQVARLSGQLGDPRFECYSRIVRCWLRLLEGKAVEAEDIARSALEDGHDYPLCLIDGLIARGEARLAIGKIPAAIKNFEDALAAGGDTPRTRATCLLLLTKAHARHNDRRKARQYYDEWTRRQPAVTTAFHRKLESEAQAALNEKSDDYLVRYNDEDADPRQLENKLHKFLANRAKEKSKTDMEAAERLGISKQTYYKWLAGQEKDRLLE
jgi:tetratricopeptide (TPR) repeat protein